MLYSLIATILTTDALFINPAFGGKSKSKSKGPKGKGNGNGNGNDMDTTTTATPITTDHNDCEYEPPCYEEMTMPGFCEYASYQWDDPSTPLQDRNNIGRASLLTPANVLKAKQLISQGKSYKLSYTFTNSIPAFGTRTWYTSLRMPDPGFGTPDAYYLENVTQCGTAAGYLDSRLFTSALGNSGTQFDGLGHAFYMNGAYGDHRHYLFHNGFTGDDIMREFGVQYIGIESLPPIITRAILLDVAGFLGQDPIPEDTQIDTQIVEDVLAFQGMDVDDIEEGDVVLVYTGYAGSKWFSGDSFGYYALSPGLTLDTVLDIFGPKGVVMLGADTWGVEYVETILALTAPLHQHWIVCNGGFLYENMNLVEWATDAQDGVAPYIGAFFYTPTQIEGAVGGLGTPVVIV